PDGGVFRYEYDPLGRLVLMTGPDGAITRFGYDDAADRLAWVEREGVRTQYQYDSRGRVERARIGNAGMTVYTWDESGRVLAARNSRVEERYTYDTRGRIRAIAQILDGVELRLELEFDEWGRLGKLRYPGSARTVSFEYDGQGRPRRVAIGKL